MSKFAKKTALLLSLASLVTTAAVYSAQKSDGVQTAYAHPPVSQTATDETTLLAPTTYQQYLSLTDPMDVAATADYMAIADDNLIYVYDVKDGNYRKYEHTLNQADPSKNGIMQLQFYEDDGLYFLDGTYLYLLDPETLQVSNVSITETDPKFPCSSFLIVDGVLYYTDVKTQASISYITLDGTDASTLAYVDSKPTIAFWGDELYYTEAAKYLRKVNPKTEEDVLVADFPDDLVSMQIKDNLFICTTLSGDFYAYNLSELASARSADQVTPLAHYEGDYSSLSLLGDYAYAVKGNSIRQYSLESSAFTDFEICNASASVHRFNGAEEVLLFDGSLYIADNGNARISVYDIENARFKTPIPLDFAPKYLASNETTLVVADGTQAAVYGLTENNYGTRLATFNAFNGTLVGAAHVYGKYYFATDSNHYYAAIENADENGDPVWTLRESKKISTRYAKMLTADAYGYLYVASGSGVYRFTEDAFLSETAEGEPLNVTLPANTAKILVDYDGGVYALSEGKVYKTTATEPYPLNDPLVYSESATVQSFAFGIEDNATYLLYEENYLAQTSVLDLPTVKNIPVNGVDEGIFNTETAAVELVNLRERAMLIDFDLTALSSAEVFPYLDYSRRETPLTALKIGQTTNGKHAILVFYDGETRSYRSCLALTSDCSALTDEESAARLKTYDAPQTMYATNEVPVYKFPHLSGLPTLTALPRSAEFSVLGEVNDLDYSYYLVQYEDESGTHTGYIPKAYAIDFDPTPPEANTTSYGNGKTNKDGIRRLAFLLLGGAAILILTDVLIFRVMKKKKDD